MTFFAFSALFNFFISLILGFLILIKDRKRKESRLFVYWAFSFVVWSFGYYFWQISTEEQSALFWCRFLTIGSVFIPIFYFHFVACLLKITGKNKIIILSSYVLASIFSFAAAFTPYMVKAVEPRLFFDLWPVPGFLYKFYLIWFFGIFGYAWMLLWINFKKIIEEKEKTALKILLFGVVFGVIGGSTNFPLWYEIPLPPWGNIAVSIFLIITAAALVKYRLLNIKTILTEILVIVMGVVLAIFPFFISEWKIKIVSYIIFIFYCLIGYLLIKATANEVAAKENLEEKVKDRTKELAEKNKTLQENNEELNRWYQLTIGREARMAELKEQIRKAEEKTG